jgi:deoxycytidylate deaminase
MDSYYGTPFIPCYHPPMLQSPFQSRYHTIELEALAIFKCITRMKSFLLGRNIIIYTDNCPLCHMMNKKIVNRRVEKNFFIASRI